MSRGDAKVDRLKRGALLKQTQLATMFYRVETRGLDRERWLTTQSVPVEPPVV